MRTFVFCTILVFCFLTVLFGQRFQTSFSGEESFENTVSIPNKILKILKRDEEVKRCFGINPTNQYLSSWFEATKINLNNDNYTDLLLKVKDDIKEKLSNCINGNAFSFWVFIKTPKNYDLVLYNYSYSIKINKKKLNGFYEIYSFRNTPSELFTRFYGFNGKRYILKSTKVKRIN